MNDPDPKNEATPAPAPTPALTPAEKEAASGQRPWLNLAHSKRHPWRYACPLESGSFLLWDGAAATAEMKPGEVLSHKIRRARAPGTGSAMIKNRDRLALQETFRAALAARGGAP